MYLVWNFKFEKNLKEICKENLRKIERGTEGVKFQKKKC